MTREERTAAWKKQIDARPKYPTMKQMAAAVIAAQAASKAETDPDKLIAVSDLYPEWAVGVAYKTGDLVNYAGNLYRVVWDHTSVPNGDPISGPSNFVNIADPAIEYPDWVQPYAHNPYKKGDRVTYNSKKYVLDVDSSTYPPGVVVGQWREII